MAFKDQLIRRAALLGLEIRREFALDYPGATVGKIRWKLAEPGWSSRDDLGINTLREVKARLDDIRVERGNPFTAAEWITGRLREAA